MERKPMMCLNADEQSKKSEKTTRSKKSHEAMMWFIPRRCVDKTKNGRSH